MSIDVRSEIEHLPAAPIVARARVPDLEVLEDAVVGLPLEVERLGPAAAPVDFARLDTDVFSLLICSVGGPLRSVGGSPDGVLVLAVQLEDGDGAWNGHAFEPASAWIYGSGAEHEGIGRVPPVWASLTMSADDVESGRFGEPGEGLGAPAGLRVVQHQAVIGLGQTISGVRSILAEAPSDARLGLAAAGVEEAVSEVLALGRPVPPIPPSASARILSACIAAGREIGPRPSLHSLSVAMNLSERWVRAAFVQELGVAPAAYFRLRALHGARRELISKTPAEASVTETAMRWGFWHLGRFSGTYRWIFGEPPSQTLRRTRFGGASSVIVPARRAPEVHDERRTPGWPRARLIDGHDAERRR